MSAKPSPAKSPKPPPKKPERFKQEEVAEALRESRGFVSAAARKLACDPATIYDYMARYPVLKVIRHDAREEEKDVAELALGKAIRNGEAWAICFYLKTQAKDRGYIERSEVWRGDLAQDFIDQPADQSLKTASKSLEASLSAAADMGKLMHFRRKTA